MNTPSPRTFPDLEGKPPVPFSGYARITTVFKVVLPLLAVVLAVAVFLYSDPAPQNESGIRFELEGLDRRGSAIHMVNPSSRGYDDRGRPYVIQAESAARATDNPEHIVFYELEASLGDKSTGDPGEVTLSAGRGLLDTADKRLDLYSSIVVRSGQGYEVQTDKVFVDLEAGVLESPETVSATGPMGILNANAMTIRDEGQTLSFRDGVRMVIKPGASEQALPAEE